MKVKGYDLAMEAQGEGQPLISVHGSASDYQTWQEQQPHFAGHFTTIRYSRRYHWPNEPIIPGADYSMDQYVSDLAELIRGTAEPPVHLVGHSYGAFVCLLAALDFPELVQSMVLAEPPVYTLFVSSQPRPLELFRLMIRRPRTALGIMQFGASGFSPATEAVRQGDMDRALDIFGRATLGKSFYENLSNERWQQARRNLIAAEFLGSGMPLVSPKQLGKLEALVLLLGGEHSPRFFRLLLDAVQEFLRSAERVEIEGASQLSHEDRPDAFRQAALSFLVN